MVANTKITAMKGKVKDGYNFWLYEPEIKNTIDIFLLSASPLTMAEGSAPTI